MKNGEWIETLEKHELAYRIVNGCWQCGFYQQNLRGDWFCTQKDKEEFCDVKFDIWKDFEL